MQVEELVQKDVDFIRVQSKVKIEATHGTIVLQIHAFGTHGKTAIPSDDLGETVALARLKGRCQKIKDVKC